MPVDSNNNEVFISRKNSGFSDYLDFNSMRTNAINYLGPITSKYWTDYNVHDPGITILEVLIYGLVDLGYRASFSIDDILARDPADKTKDNNFYSQAQLLGSNPLSIVDYRKKLMDIEEVRNAWLEMDISNPVDGQSVNHSPVKNTETYLNGLYQVYIELEKDIIDFKTDKEWELYKDKVFHKVRSSLMGHRNLCEDFTHIHFLCKIPVGICSDIEITPGSDVGEIYQGIANALHDFFSPVPNYYSLGQLTAKNIPIDAIFSGRPYNGLPSYGFILDNELPVRPTAETAIHISDIYQLILQVAGVTAIRKLQLHNCDNNDPKQPDSTKDWEFFLPPEFIPEFSLSCSGFRFFQNGQLLSTDLSSYNTILQMNFAHQGKVIYQAGEPNLDNPIPNGTLRKGLGDYYSIQNDFPKVYGIGPGGLPTDVSALRKSQTLQLKGYLLFFDQLLADYLSQLSHIRDLFSLAPASNPQNNHTYFAGDLSSTPDLAGLLRFPGTAGAVNVGPSAGTILLFPVNEKEWDKISQPGVLSCVNRQQLEPYLFASAQDRSNAIDELTLLFTESFLSVNYIQTESSDPDKNQFMYYISGTLNGFVLVSKNIFPDMASATKEASTVLFIGAAKENYSLISTNDSYSFNLLQTASSYYNYLQTILESNDQYIERRTGFLNHLISRFAESFTDYALLATGFLSTSDINAKKIGLTEQFLSHFTELSSNRGKAGNYLQYGWNDENISGFEKRYKAYCGIENWSRHYLCNFEVYKYEEKYNIKIALADEMLFMCPSPFYKKETMPAAQSLFQVLADKKNYKATYLEDQQEFVNEVQFYQQQHAFSVRTWKTKEKAQDEALLISTMCRLSPVEEDIWISQYDYKLELRDYHFTPVRTSVQGFVEEKNALSAAKKMLSYINDLQTWAIDESHRLTIGKLYQNKEEGLSSQYIDIKAFKIYIQKDILGKPDRCSFEVLDQLNTFQFRSSKDFATEEKAKAACYNLLFQLTETNNYQIRTNQYAGVYRIWVTVNGEDVADTEKEFDNSESAMKMIHSVSNSIKQKLYTLDIITVPVRWKFNFYLGLPGKQNFLFQSKDAYKDITDAMKAASIFHDAGPYWKIRKDKKGFLLEIKNSKVDAPACRLAKTDDQNKISEDELKTELSYLLRAKEDIYKLASDDEEIYSKFIQPDEPSKQGTHVYRLLDKDHPKAFHPVSTKSTNKMDAEMLRDELILKGRKGCNYLQICLGGDNVVFEAGSVVEAGQYYFQVKCRNDYFSRKGISVKDHELVLFESVKGYGSIDDAQLDFQKFYLEILKKGMDKSNYGDGEYISLKDRTDIKKYTGNKASTVLVPLETRNIFAYASIDIVKELMNASRSYPICCNQKQTKYHFVLINDKTGHIDWRSATDFDTATDASEAFNFFLLLLNYPGNYFIEFDESDCSYRVGIREVLAESLHTFKDAEEAWGAKGVERFICLAQSEGGFHMNMRKNCTYSYFVACPNNEAIHPCVYETAEKRDEARIKLYHEAIKFPDNKWLSGFAFVEKAEKKNQPSKFFETEKIKKEKQDTKKHETATIYGLDGKAIAEIHIIEEGLTVEKALNAILDMEDAVWAGNNIMKDEKGLYLQAGTDKPRIRALHKSISLKEWEKELLTFAAYFPVTRKINAQGDVRTSTFCMEIKLPGFVDLPGSNYMGKDCGCEPVEPEKPSHCYVAWRSKIVYKNGMAAWDAYNKLLPLLRTIENYRPVFDSCCGDGYGIELLEKNDIVATGPQYYFYPEMAYDAASRAVSCINAEGLDIVEHILLRPRNGDEKNEEKIPICNQDKECASIWKDSLNIILGTEPPLYFQAGQDPHSFIMTVALPAWPQRFRKKENRVLLESILQREAPAHILLRILWLTPMDMCRFEGYYKSWLDWLSLKKQCGDFAPAEFVEFLFYTSFACLNECIYCTDMTTQTVTVANPCVEDDVQIDISQANKDWLSQINLLYCWKDMACSNTSEWKPKAKHTKELKKEHNKEIDPVEIISVVETVIGVTEVFDGPDLSEKQKSQLINTRLRKYRDLAKNILKLLNEDELADKTEKFLLKPDPSQDQFEKLFIELVIPFKKARSKRKKNINSLLEVVIWFYLDKICLAQMKGTSFDLIQEIFDRNGFIMTDPDNFYGEWKPEEMKQLTPVIDTDKLKSIIQKRKLK